MTLSLEPWFSWRAPIAFAVLACALTACGGGDAAAPANGASTAKTEPAAQATDDETPRVTYAP